MITATNQINLKLQCNFNHYPNFNLNSDPQWYFPISILNHNPRYPKTIPKTILIPNPQLQIPICNPDPQSPIQIPISQTHLQTQSLKPYSKSQYPIQSPFPIPNLPSIIVKDLKFLIPDKKKIWLQSDQLSTPLRHSLPLDPVTDTWRLRFMNHFRLTILELKILNAINGLGYINWNKLWWLII